MPELESEIRTPDPQELQRLLAARTAEISALERAARVFGAMHHPGEDIYFSLAQQAAELLQAEMGIILLHDAQENSLAAQTPTLGIPDEVVHGLRVPLDGESPAAILLQGTAALMIHDAAHDPVARQMGLDDLSRRIALHSVLMVGLRHDGKLLGAIQLCNKRDGRRFQDDDARLLAIFASQAAIAIQNARLLRRAQRHAEEMASLYEIASALVTATDLDEMLNTVLAQVRRVVDYDGCFINLVTSDGKALRVRAVEGQDATRMLGVEYSTEQGINAWIYRNARPTLVADANTDPRRMHIEGRTETIRTAVGAPLVADGEPIGTIYAVRAEARPFSAADLQFLTLTATQVAAAVQRARLLDQAQQRAQEMESISRIGAVMAYSLDVEHVLQTIYEQAGLIMDTRAFFVALYDAEGDSLHFKLVYDEGEQLDSFDKPLADNQGLTAHVVRTGQPLLIRDLEIEAASLSIAPLVIGQPSRSWLGVPILAREQVVGVISAQSYEPYAFSSRQMRLLSAIANQAGISLQNAQLYEAVRAAHQVAADQRDKLAHLHRVVVQVQRTDTLPAKLQLIADGIREVGWQRVSVSLRDAEFNVTEVVRAGFGPKDGAKLHANLISSKEWQKRFGQEFERYRLSHCYYLPWSDPWVREQVHGLKGPVPDQDVDTWHPQDLLYLPLYGREKRIIGIISLDEPVDGRRPTAESLHIIELFAQETALTIENAQLLADMRLLNTDLQEMLHAQARLLQTVEDLASPVVPIVDGVIVLPLIGHVDGRRAGQVLRTLLSGVEEHRAQMVLLDITGVPVIDTQVAHHLMQAVRASRLLGAEAILVGIRPDVAQTLVTLGVHLGDVVTRSDLQSGFEFALDVIGRRLAVPRSERTTR